MTDSPTFCSYLWNHSCIRPDGILQPCCHFWENSNTKHPWDTEVDPVATGTLHQELREKALKGEKIDGCQKCYTLEKNNALSPRLAVNNRYKSFFEKNSSPLPATRYLEVFLSDTCNLKCVTCTPRLSSKWREDFLKLGWELPPRPQVFDYTPVFKNLKHLEKIRFVGGEPLLDPLHEQYIQTLEKQVPEKIELCYSTNASVVPSEDVIDRWSRFKRLNIDLSIDGFGKSNDFIRFPSTWEQIETNFLFYLDLASKLPNLNININCTVSVLNVWYVDTLEKWVKKTCEKYNTYSSVHFLCNLVTHPEMLSILNLAPNFRVKALKTLDSQSTAQKPIINWLKNKPNELDSSLISYLRSLEKVRKITIAEYLPELEEYLNSSSIKNATPKSIAPVVP